MSGFLKPQGKMKYDRSNLFRAYEATQKGISVYRASRMYGVPESTLRDRTRALVPLDVKIGFQTLFTKKEEEKLVDHISYMADIGYGYNVSKIKYMARDYALHLGKTVRSNDCLRDHWFYDFVKRWPSLKIAKPQKLSMSRAKAASRAKIDSYYIELGSILTTHNLHDKPERIFNIDESGISTEHTPPKVVCDKNTTPQAVTSSRDKLVTIIAGGNALGNSIPPYYVFPGKRWNNEFLTDACVGANGEMSKNGWSNTEIFQKYVMNHFARYANLSDEVPTLILYDGHKSHISLTLSQWAKDHNAVLFVLPPHTSHLTQPLDVGVFGPLKAMYNKECHDFLKQNPGISITKYNVAALTAKPYMKALSAENLMSAFKKTGVFPFDKLSISDSQVAPAVIYCETSDCQAIEETQSDPANAETLSTKIHQQSPASPIVPFFEKRTISKVVTNKKKRKFVPPYLSGSLLKKENIEIMTQSAKKSKQDTNVVKPSTSEQIPDDTQSQSILSEDADTDVDDEVCCVCNAKEPFTCDDIDVFKWGKCDLYSHWTHIKYCCKVTVLRRASEFRCPHCDPKQ